MFDYPYYFWLVVVPLLIPLIGIAGGWAYTQWSSNPQPLWVTLPSYLIVHVVGLPLSMCCGLDYDYLGYRRNESILWIAAYHGGYLLSLIGLATLLWAGLRKPRYSHPQAFDVLRR